MWFSQTKKAKKQLKLCQANNCPDCEKCIHINESSSAQFMHNKIKETKAIEHPLYNLIIEKFNGV